MSLALSSRLHKSSLENVLISHRLQQQEEPQTCSAKNESHYQVFSLKYASEVLLPVMYVVLLIVLFVYISKDHIACSNIIALQYRPGPNSHARIIHHLANSLHRGVNSCRCFYPSSTISHPRPSMLILIKCKTIIELFLKEI